MNPARIRITVVGAGSIGPRHARTVSAETTAKLVAVVDPSANGFSLAKELDVPHFLSVAQLIDSPDNKPDGAIVCTPNDTHVPVSLELVRAGIHVLVEKPISINIPSALDLIYAAQTANVQVLVGHHRRFNPYVAAAKQALHNGRIGEVTAVNGLWLTRKPNSYFEDAPWKQSQAHGGPIFINLIHDVDLLMYLLGPITRVYAERTISRRQFEAEEGAACTLRFANGAVGTFLVCDNTPSPHFFESGTGENPIIPQAGEDFYRVFGTKGVLEVPSMKIWQSEDWQNPGSQHDLNDGVRTKDVPFVEQLKHFVNVVKGAEDPKCSGREGLRAVAVCEALKTSMLEERPVSIAVM